MITNKPPGVLCKGMWMVRRGAFVSRFSCGLSLLSGADWAQSVLHHLKARYSLFIYFFLASNPVLTFHSTFLCSHGGAACLLLAEMFTLNLLCVYVKTLLGFWWGCSTTNTLVPFALCKQHLRVDWKLQIGITCLLSFQKSACLSLFFSPPPTAAFTLKTIEVIRSNITSLERCHRGADFKCVWVIVPI